MKEREYIINATSTDKVRSLFLSPFSTGIAIIVKHEARITEM